MASAATWVKMMTVLPKIIKKPGVKTPGFFDNSDPFKLFQLNFPVCNDSVLIFYTDQIETCRIAPQK